MELADALRGVRRLAIDSAPIIYFLEANPTYDALVTPIFTDVDQGIISAVTPTITLTEVLVHPLLLGSRQLRVIEVDSTIAVLAAALRSRDTLRTPDALQVATAVHTGCDAFLTNGRRLNRVSEVRVVVLDDLEQTSAP